IDFFWTAQHLLVPTAVTALAVLFVFVIVESILYLKDRRVSLIGEAQPPLALRLRGGINFLLIGAIVVATLVSAIWQPDMH
ncbi:sodium:proton antiporter, partial [Klebsiella pneumoniae]|uniref:sodium:proton antiporter n=1 Tax=Klebsiella pneumoniae TaxID=573 RepID=UPI003013FE34